MKTWVLVVSLVLLLALVSAFVGIGAWHMAYEEASFQGTLNQESALEAGRKWCKEFVNEILLQQSKQLKHIQETLQQKKKVNIGVLGLNIYGTHIVKEAVADLMQDNLSNYYYEVRTSLYKNKSLVDEAQELSQLLDVNVFVGPETESDLKLLLVWARTRPPKSSVVFVTPALIKDDVYFDRRNTDSHVVIRMQKPASASLRATFSLMNKQDISVVLMLVSPDDHSSEIIALTGFKNIEVKEIITSDITPIEQIKVALENVLISSTSSDGNMGLLITMEYMFQQLSEFSSNSWIFSLPWFTTVNVLHDPSFVNYNFLAYSNFSLNYALFIESSAKNEVWHQNVSRRVGSSGLYRTSDKEYISSILEPVYDSVIVASHVGSWLSNELVKVDALSRRISWESSLWAGMSGLLKISETFERTFNKYLNIRLSRNLSSQIIQYPSGTWQVLNLSDI